MMFRDKMELALFAFSSPVVPIRFLSCFIRQHGFLGAFHGSWRLEEGIGVFSSSSFVVCRSYEIIIITLVRRASEAPSRKEDSMYQSSDDAVVKNIEVLKNIHHRA